MEILWERGAVVYGVVPRNIHRVRLDSANHAQGRSSLLRSRGGSEGRWRVRSVGGPLAVGCQGEGSGEQV
jgi:hypothetical protein